MIKISERANSLGTENAFVVLAEVEKLRASGRNIVSFCIGQPDFPTPEYICNAATQAMADGHTGYTPSAGIAPLRKAVVDYVSRTRQIEISEDAVVCGCGAKPFIAYSIQAVTDRDLGHEVIYPSPGFAIYESQVRAQGAVPVPLGLRESNNFHFDLQELADSLNDRTRLVILNSPHNPTGVVYEKAYLQEIADILSEWENIWVFSDEPYHAFVYDCEFASIASIDKMLDRTILVDSVSKTWSMTGWRVGFAINQTLASVFSRMITNTDSCAPHPNQYAAAAALSGSNQSVLTMRDEFQKRRDHIVADLNTLKGVECPLPGGAFYAWAEVSELCELAGVSDSGELAEQLLHKAGVAVLADAHFGTPLANAGQHLRFSYACPIEQIDSGLSRIREYIQQLS
ncbi:MAG: aminotransferase class I/II-fold pyridoxal phosphate-dependent enzyme [Gammaproteobacteria bacterium]|nr:aminotransferase class I/II-fold pyridoxal phosphate-dependent enzyme [Gammaproteobacteria bacterium]